MLQMCSLNQSCIPRKQSQTYIAQTAPRKTKKHLLFCCILSVSPWPSSNRLPGANVTLRCSLITYEGPGQCFTLLYRGMSLKLQDDTRPDTLTTLRYTKCHVTLKVPIQRGSRFSCLALVNRQVQSRVQFPVQGVEKIPSRSLTHSLTYSLTDTQLGVVDMLGSSV